jgi:branched-chain amino acid aminotransferase
VVVIVRPLPDYPESLYLEGVRTVIVPMMRATRGGLDPRIKSSNLLVNVLALREAQKHKAYEAILLNSDGYVAEGSMSNIFMVAKRVVRTAPLSAGILEGITRELLIDVARARGIAVEEKAFRPEELLRADEAFMTASARQIVPIVQVDETRIATGKPGPITRALIAAYKDRVTELSHRKVQE